MVQDDYELLEIEETPAPTRAPLDHLNAKRIVEVHVERSSRRLSLYASIGNERTPIELPGGVFDLGDNSPALLLELLKVVTGGRFERMLGGPPTREVWIRADYAARLARERRRWDDDPGPGHA